MRRRIAATTVVWMGCLWALGCASTSKHAGAGADAGTKGEGLQLPPPIDPRAIGAFPLSTVRVVAFSQTATSDRDRQVLDLKPDLVPRAWNQWDRSGLTSTDYDRGYPDACRANGTLFIGGLTASVIFADEMTAAEFADMVGRDAAGDPVPHKEIVPGAYRASLASAAFRQLLIRIAKLQIDAGVDGLFFDEVNSSYIGAAFDGNEGFDDHHSADFGRFLCAKHGQDPAALAAFDLVPADGLDCASAESGAAFKYRGYLARHGFQRTPLSSSNKLAADWGSTIQNRPDPAKDNFVETFSSLIYWQEIVVAVRTYARETYGKEILITGNGILPFVDFQSVGLYDGNNDGAGPMGFDYVPTTGTASDVHLNGSVSFLAVLQSLKDRSKRIVSIGGGHEVPVHVFLDWPTGPMERYYSLPTEERKDYIRLRLAESYALGMRFALPLSTTTDTNTATVLGMMDFFQSMRSFYQEHAELYGAGHDSTAAPVVSATGVATHLVTFDGGRTVVHLINHNYAKAFVPQPGLTVTFPLGRAPTSVKLVSPDSLASPDAPDLAADQTAAFTYDNGQVTVSIGMLISSLSVVAE